MYFIFFSQMLSFKNGLSALGIAAREGYADICESLINSGAFVNQSDKLVISSIFLCIFLSDEILTFSLCRYGNWILISAVRSGNANIVRLLLEKFADVNARDSVRYYLYAEFRFCALF